MRTHLRALAVFKIAVCGRDAAFPGLAAIAIAAGAHRTSGLAPEKSSIAKHAVEPSRFRFAFDAARSRYDHGHHALGHAAATHDFGRELQVRQAAVGAGADKAPIHRQADERRPRHEPHIAERIERGGATARIEHGRIRHAARNADDLAWIGSPSDLWLERGAIERDLAIEGSVVIAG